MRLISPRFSLAQAVHPKPVDGIMYSRYTLKLIQYCDPGCFVCPGWQLELAHTLELHLNHEKSKFAWLTGKREHRSRMLIIMHQIRGYRRPKRRVDVARRSSKSDLVSQVKMGGSME